ncbi:MAG TPA: hypothetical protein DF712_20385 [Balneola sp.]|nr:hypothetical protein [Balneola sp.]
MSKSTRLPMNSKSKRYASRYAQGGLNIKGTVISATTKSVKPSKIKIAATGDKFNTYKTRIT